MTPAAPYVSLGMMLGDAHVPVIGRCLRSVIYRASCAALVDEIVLGWNGKDDKGLKEQLGKLGYLKEQLVKRGYADVAGFNLYAFAGPAQSPKPPITVVPFEWPGRFDTARNTYWKHMKGEWLLWLDGDDIVADTATDAGLAAVNACEKDYGMPLTLPYVKGTSSDPTTSALSRMLRTLPQGINTVLMPYDYVISPEGYVHVRQNTKRIVRKSVGHVWWSPEQSGVHELLMPVGAIPERSITTFGMLVRHFPVEGVEHRSARNAAIVQKMSAGNVNSFDARHNYDLANARVVAGDIDKADLDLKRAIQNSTNDADAYTYRLARADLAFKRNQPEAAQQEAFAAIALQPERQTAYYVAAEALFRMGKHAGCIEFFERGATKQPALQSIDHPLAIFAPPRLQAALAHQAMGNPEKALPLLNECLERYGELPLVKEVSASVIEAAERKAGLDKLLDTLDWLQRGASPALADEIIEAVGNVSGLRGIESVLRFRTLQARAKTIPAFLYPSWTGKLAPSGKAASSDGLFSKGGAEKVDTIDVFNFARDERLCVLNCVKDKQHTFAFHLTAEPQLGQSIAFYAPTGVAPWKCSDVTDFGMGGSEGSVAYLARELAAQGRRVVVYSMGGDNAFWQGTLRGKPFAVEQRPLQQFNAAHADLIVACRAPWTAGEVDLKGHPCFVWHQDNGYGNPWMWAKPVVERAAGQLHVSAWARDGLMKEADVTDLTLHHVIGNGITDECFDWAEHERDMKRVLYASDPSRGLEALLDAWPEVLKHHPDARLIVACNFVVMLTLKQDAPGIPAALRVRRVQELLSTTKNVDYVGWVPHEKVLALMKTSNVYCYPGGPMPEGFGVALAQAQACGCEVIAPKAGALPEVLRIGDVNWLGEDGVALAERISKALAKPIPAVARAAASAALREQHSWEVVTSRFLKAIGEV